MNQTEKILEYYDDIKIESVREITEYFIWTCPKCGNNNRTSEWNITNCTLFCAKCHKETKYKFTHSKAKQE